MKLEHILEGKEIRIKDHIFDVLRVEKEADIRVKGKDLNPVMRIAYLHDKSAKDLMPTHELWQYEDTGKMVITGRDGKRELKDKDVIILD